MLISCKGAWSTRLELVEARWRALWWSLSQLKKKKKKKKRKKKEKETKIKTNQAITDFSPLLHSDTKHFLMMAAREDGRSSQAQRPLLARLQVNGSPSCAGSAYVELGRTRVSATVYGPHDAARPGGTGGGEAAATVARSAAPGDESGAGVLSVEVRLAAPWGGSGGVERERALAAAICSALAPSLFLDRLPRAAVEVAVTYLSSDGGAWAAGVIAASLALADAGVEARGLVAASGVGRLASAPNSLLSDLTGSEEASAVSITAVAVCRAAASASTGGGRIVGLDHLGATPAAQVAADVAAAVQAAASVDAAMRGALLASEMKRQRQALVREAREMRAASAAAEAR